MERLRKLLLFLAVFVTGTFLTCCAERERTPINCECVNFNNQYMNCSCCPPNVTTAYAYRIDYKYGSTQSTTTCKSNWSSDPAIRCDCMFCGTIRDTEHRMFNLCKNMDLPRPFLPRMDYTLNVTAVKDGLKSNAALVINSGDSILKPAPVEFVDSSSMLSSNDSVLITLKWRPNEHVKYTDLKYWVNWKKQGDNALQSTETSYTEVTLRNLDPNSVYEMSVKCRPIKGGYFSDLTRPLSVLTVEKCFEKSPTLVSYIADHSKCPDSSCAEITLFWQPLTPNMQWANCTSYLLEVKGSSETFNQTVPCNDVMAVFEKPVPSDETYDVNLYVLSDVCTSPPSHLRIQTRKRSEETAALPEVKLLNVRKNSSLIVTINWLHSSNPPDRYGVFYCKKGSVPCEGDVTEYSFEKQPSDLSVFTLEDPGFEALYNVAPYWGNVTTGLSPHWLCPYEDCGEILKPEVVLDGAEVNSLSLRVLDPQCSPLQTSRGLPDRFEVEVESPEGEEVFSEVFRGSGPILVKVPSLSSNTTYLVNVQSHGKCGKVRRSVGKFTTSKNGAAGGRKDWVIFLGVAGVVLLLCGVFMACWCYRHMKARRDDLDAEAGQTRKALSAISSSSNGYHIKKWLDDLPPLDDDTNFDDYEAMQPDFGIFKEAVEERKPSEHEEKCREVFAKCRDRMTYKLCCLPRQKQDTVVADPVPLEGNSASVTKMTELYSDKTCKDQNPAGDSSCVRESSCEKQSAPEADYFKLDKPVVNSEEPNPQSGSHAIQEDKSSPVDNNPEVPEPPGPAQLANPVSASECLQQPAEEDPLLKDSVKADKLGDNQQASGSGLPMYTQCEGDNDYQKLPLDCTSVDDETYDRSSSEDEDESTDPSSLPFEAFKPQSPAHHDNIILT